jgi:precorrin-3B C17-methyltransferase
LAQGAAGDPLLSGSGLAAVAVPNPSETVAASTPARPSVSEAAALLAANADKTLAHDRKTQAARSRRPQRHRLHCQDPPMTPPETPQKTGKIMLVGLGPGSSEHLTYRARAAIAEADTVIGYVTYIRLVADLVEGKEVIKKSMTEELDRAIEALDRARQGKKVALMSSGDAGVYGMAGPTFEVLFQAGWTPDSDIEVEIIPGASALNTCAALVGAPLTHDFCAISLSDLLTPWPTIARRLDATAYVRLRRRPLQPQERPPHPADRRGAAPLPAPSPPDTPVAIVKSAYRKKQRIEFTTLEKMGECDIGMLSTVLIGNSNTFVRHGLMVTPRGYANKYAVDGGGAAPSAGEQAGRSLSTGLNGWIATIQASGKSAAELAANTACRRTTCRSAGREPCSCSACCSVTPASSISFRKMSPPIRCRHRRRRPCGARRLPQGAARALQPPARSAPKPKAAASPWPKVSTPRPCAHRQCGRPRRPSPAASATGAGAPPKPACPSWPRSRRRIVAQAEVEL